MRVLILASKCPWPPSDGGRLALWQTIKALAGAGATIQVLAPEGNSAQHRAAENAMAPYAALSLFPGKPLPWWRAALAAVTSGDAVSLQRHAHVAAQPEVRARIAAFAPDVIHVEALQSIAVLGPPPWPAPVVLRMQNVESHLWQQWPGPMWSRILMRLEAARMRKAERRILQQVDLTLAITPDDTTDLRANLPAAKASRVQYWPVPFPSSLPPGPQPVDSQPDASPCVVLPGSRGWGPNRQAFDWAIRFLAPALAARAPDLVMRVFAPNRDPSWPQTVQVAPIPDDADALFPAHAIAAIPLFAGSGIRMRILEAWARGLPVVATSIAARGLTVRKGEHLLLADTPESFADALRQLATDPTLRTRLIDAGRRYLRDHHDPALLGPALWSHYRHVLNSAITLELAKPVLAGTNSTSPESPRSGSAPR